VDIRGEMTMLWGLARSPEKVLKSRSCRLTGKRKIKINTRLIREENLLFEEEREMNNRKGEKRTIERERNEQ
jgi:hypothetical protein